MAGSDRVSGAGSSGHNRLVGNRGEDAAAAWYEAAGYVIVDRNWRCREGELDLVVAAPGVLVFCEVKTRSSLRYGSPAEAVTYTKQHRIRGLAMAYVRANRPRVGSEVSIRFDVATVMGTKVNVIESAF